MSDVGAMEPPKSKQFDDVYFSVEDGLAESRFVFLERNNLPDGWRGKDQFVICETGFGTGLNFLSAWKLFDETTSPQQRLDFISFEKYPLKVTEIEEYLAHWKGEFGDRLQVLLGNYPPLIPGFHNIILNEKITLTLIFDDVNDAIPDLDAAVDAWFLDGFKPATNPGMWSEILFENMARLSHPGTRFSTFTAAGLVRRGLSAAGFDVEKVRGFGRKRDMTVGMLPSENT